MTRTQPTDNGLPDESVSALRELALTRTVAMDRALVWRLWTEPQHLAQWWGPHGFTNPECSIEPRPGGRLRILMRSPDGQEYLNVGIVQVAEPPERLVFTIALLNPDGSRRLENLTTVDLIERGTGTEVTVRVQVQVLQATTDAGENLAGMRDGWSESLARLAEKARSERNRPMRRLVLKMSMTLDGYVGGPNGEVDWIMRTLDRQATAWIEQTLWQAGAHLVGRRTYADMVGYWPTSTESLASPMNAIPKIVFSRSGSVAYEPTTALRDATDARRRAGYPVVAPAAGWDDTRVLGADLAEQITALKAEPGKDLLAHGGASFARSVIRLGLIDEYRLLVHPVVLGSGLALFDGTAPLDLTLVDETTFPSGIQGLVYRPK